MCKLILSLALVLSASILSFAVGEGEDSDSERAPTITMFGAGGARLIAASSQRTVR